MMESAHRRVATLDTGQYSGHIGQHCGHGPVVFLRQTFLAESLRKMQ